MDYQALLALMREALVLIDNPRFFESEYGFQGELRAKLESLKLQELLHEGSIIEQEHQKSLTKHGLTIRPDLIIHQPFDPSRHASRRQGNIAVIELKLRASQKKAMGDFESLGQMLDVLEYPLGIFINIGSETTHANLVPAPLRGRIVCYAVWQNNGKVSVREDSTM